MTSTKKPADSLLIASFFIAIPLVLLGIETKTPVGKRYFGE
jgi:hypothetical protein